MIASTEATTVLVVEDDQAVADLVRSVLHEISECRVLVAYDSQRARDLLQHVRADILVLDVMLPGESGIELLADLRRDPRWRNVPVIIMSANVDEARVVAALGTHSATQYLAKPFDIDDLVDAVEAAKRHTPAASRRPVASASNAASQPNQDWQHLRAS